jgi:hypothetical protein
VEIGTDPDPATRPKEDHGNRFPRSLQSHAGRSGPAPSRNPTSTEPQRLHSRSAQRFQGLDEIYVDDSGLVLLWPFLERFFTRLSLLNPSGRTFDSEHARWQAVALLARLGLGDELAPEYQLSLAKLLAGVAPDLAPPLDGPLWAPLEPDAIQECDGLLAAVLEHAPALHAMDPAGLRAMFLQRPGALTVRAGTWLLQVERRTEDLLLERLTWSWAWVKLPWMPQPLQVDW